MQLDSVRQLKALLKTEVIASLATGVAARRLSVSAQPIRPARATRGGIALGIVRAGRKDFRLGVRLQRREMASSPELESIRRQAKGELDERYIGQVVKQQARPWHQRRNRPLRIGGSIGHYSITAGTLGCFVTPRSGDDVLILSNNHVLADENRGKRDDAVVQPGHLDGGRRPKHVIGKLHRFIRLKRHGPNYVDAAVCTVKEGVKHNPKRLTDLGTLAGLGDAFLDEAVAKIGRTTGLTRGRVTMFELDNVEVEFDLGWLRFDEQIEIEGDGDTAFSAGGDSGSLIVNEDCRGVGLLFSGSDQGGTNGQGLTYANPLRRVLDDLKVKLVY